MIGLWGAFLLWRRKFDTSRFFLLVATWMVLAPFVMATAGWLLTESGRQPWIVQGLMLTTDGLSGSGSATQVAISLGIVVVLYVALGVDRRGADGAARPARAAGRAGGAAGPRTPSGPAVPSLTY